MNFGIKSVTKLARYPKYRMSRETVYQTLQYLWRKMTAHKEKWPCFAWIFSVLSIAFYCAGFLRVELELNEQMKRINLLSESVEETELLANVLDLVVMARKITPGKFSHYVGRIKNQIALTKPEPLLSFYQKGPLLWITFIKCRAKASKTSRRQVVKHVDVLTESSSRHRAERSIKEPPNL